MFAAMNQQSKWAMVFHVCKWPRLLGPRPQLLFVPQVRADSARISLNSEARWILPEVLVYYRGSAVYPDCLTTCLILNDCWYPVAPKCQAVGAEKKCASTALIRTPEILTRIFAFINVSRAVMKCALRFGVRTKCLRSPKLIERSHRLGIR
jgi:hypothetical protein